MESLAEGKRQLELRKRIELHLDSGYGSCILGRPDIAEQVLKSWLITHPQKQASRMGNYAKPCSLTHPTNSSRHAGIVDTAVEISLVIGD